MKLTPILAAACLMASTAAFAETSSTSGNRAPELSSIPSQSATVTNYYKQDVYDNNDNKIGDVKDVLVDKDGKITALIIGAGGFLGMGDHDVAVPFSAVKGTQKNGKWYLTMDTTKDALKAAQGWKYDSAKTTWVPDTGTTTGSGSSNSTRSDTAPAPRSSGGMAPANNR